MQLSLFTVVESRSMDLWPLLFTLALVSANKSLSTSVGEYYKECLSDIDTKPCLMYLAQEIYTVILCTVKSSPNLLKSKGLNWRNST